MKKDTLNISKSLLIKALLLSFVLLTLTFGLGLVIGKTDDSLQNITSADEGEIREQLSDCSFKLQEITAKHLSLIKAAKKNGLMNDNGQIEKNIVCTVLGTEDTKGSQKEIQDSVRIKETVQKKEEEKEPKQIKEPEKRKDLAETENIIKKPKKKINCSFSIQLFSDPDKDKAQKAKKSYPFKNLRLVEADIRGRKLVQDQIRLLCYQS